MSGSEGLLLKRSMLKQILSVLYYGKVLNFYESTTLIKYLLRWTRSRKCTRNNWILFIFFRSRCIRLKTTSSEISSFEYLDGSVVPWYWNPSDSRACNGWILHFIQSNMTVSPVNICLRTAIRSSSSETWLSSTGFLFHSGHWIGGPGVIGGKHPDWFST